MSGTASDSKRGGKSGGGGKGKGKGKGNDKGKGKEPQRDSSGTLDLAPILESRGRLFSKAISLRVITNHFRIRSLPGKSTNIYQYGVSLAWPKTESEHPSPAVMKKAWLCIEELGHFGTQEGHATVWDGESTIWSTKLIPEMELDSLSRLLDLPGHTEKNPNQLKCFVTMQRTLDIPALVQNLTTSGSAGIVYDHTTNTLFDCFRWLTEAFRDGPASRMITYSKATTFFSDNRDEIMVSPLTNTTSLEVRRGLEQRVIFAFNTLSINVHTKCGIFRQPKKALSVVALNLSPSRSRDTERLRVNDLQILVGIQFVMQYGGTHRDSSKKRVHKISNKTARTHTFDHKGKTMTVQQYFKSRYGVTLRYPDLPLLETPKGDLMPLELAYTTSDESVKREKLNDRASSDFVTFATRLPDAKYRDIGKCVSLLNDWTDPKLERFGLDVDPNMIEVGALKLPVPEIFFQSPSQAQKRKELPTSGSWDVKNKVFVRPMGFENCDAVVYVAPHSGELSLDKIEKFTEELTDTCRAHGMSNNGKPPKVVRIGVNELIATSDEQQLCFSQQFKGQFSRPPKFVIFVIHRYEQDLYKRIKHLCDGIGIISQCMQAEKVIKPAEKNAQYRSNVALKLNSKLGGINWNVDKTSFSKLDGLMIIAADVVHAPPADQNTDDKKNTNDKIPSIAVLVGSIDEHCVKYVAEEIMQGERQEVIDQSNMEIMFVEILKRYVRANNKKPPKHVIFLRDGVSDSQVADLIGKEVAAFKAVRERGITVEDENSTTFVKLGFKITSVNCVKRHHTRFFPKDSLKENANVDPGTVVEASKNTKDFFLVAQRSPLGTSRPTRYTIIYDENNLEIGQFEAMIMQGCFGFQRATRSISLHAAVKHADRCAERARVRLRRDDTTGTTRLWAVGSRLKTSMYWL